MAKRKLAQAAKSPTKKTALDLAEQHAEASPSTTPVAPTLPAAEPLNAGGRRPSLHPISRTTDRLSISLLPEERNALEERAAEFRRNGRRDLKPSRLARVAFKMLLDTSDEDILRVADHVPNLEKLRAR